MKIAFAGCSFTYGDELENPEEERFSRLVCNKLGAEEINVSRCGMSNDLILHNFIKKPKPDIAVIQWTKVNRWQVWDDVINGWESLRPTQKYPKHLTLNAFRYYSHIYTDQHGIESYWKNVYLAEQYCKDNDIKLIMMVMNYKEQTVNYVSPYQSLCNKSKIPSIENDILPFPKRKTPEWYEYYMEKGHPSPKGHQMIADYLEAQISPSLNIS